MLGVRLGGGGGMGGKELKRKKDRRVLKRDAMRGAVISFLCFVSFLLSFITSLSDTSTRRTSRVCAHARPFHTPKTPTHIQSIIPKQSIPFHPFTPPAPPRSAGWSPAAPSSPPGTAASTPPARAGPWTGRRSRRDASPGPVVFMGLWLGMGLLLGLGGFIGVECCR